MSIRCFCVLALRLFRVFPVFVILFVMLDLCFALSSYAFLPTSKRNTKNMQSRIQNSCTVRGQEILLTLNLGMFPLILAVLNRDCNRGGGGN